MNINNTHWHTEIDKLKKCGHIFSYKLDMTITYARYLLQLCNNAIKLAKYEENNVALSQKLPNCNNES